jgi:hypothetical protein
MHTCQWEGWASGSAAACTHVSGMVVQVAQLQHAHMAVGWLGKWLSCSMHPWQLGWLGRWLNYSMHTRQWVDGSDAACTHGSGMVGKVA